MKIFYTLIALVHLNVVAAFFHPMHVSVTDIEYAEKEKMLKIMMHVFIDDLELSLRNSLNQQDVDLLQPKDNKMIDDLVGKYLKQNFKVTVDGKSQPTVYLGHEKDGEAFILFIEVSKLKKFKTIQVQNSIITETHDDQNNLVNVTLNETVRSLRLTRNNPVDKITFE